MCAPLVDWVYIMPSNFFRLCYNICVASATVCQSAKKRDVGQSWWRRWWNRQKWYFSEKGVKEKQRRKQKGAKYLHGKVVISVFCASWPHAMLASSLQYDHNGMMKHLSILCARVYISIRIKLLYFVSSNKSNNEKTTRKICSNI